MMFAFRPLGVLRWLREFVSRYPLQCALIVALVACGWLWRGLNAERAKVSDLTALIVSERAAYAKAQAEAERLAIEARAATEKLSKGLADAADAQARHLDADSRRNLAERVRKAPRCEASGSVAPGVPDGAASDPSADSAGVSFTIAEAEALRQHEVRSTVCNGWAQSLIDSGLAVGE